MLGSWEIAYIDSTHRKLSKTGLRCSGTILEGGVLFIDQEAAIGSCSCSGVKGGLPFGRSWPDGTSLGRFNTHFTHIDMMLHFC